MELILEYFQQLTDPDWILHHGGLYLVMLILFIESGFFFGFFLPGDILIFVAGIIISQVENSLYPFTNNLFNLFFWQSMFIIGAIGGNYVGYWFGSYFGTGLMKREKDYWLLKKRHLVKANKFYEENGKIAITIARFFPIARTFVPIVAGTVKMNLRHFAIYNILGAVLWVIIFTNLGYVLGENDWMNRNLIWILSVFGILIITPFIFRTIKSLIKSTSNSKSR